VEVGRSAHFRYYARAADRVPVGILDLLEQHWAEMSTFFGLDQGTTINYYLFDAPEDLATHGPCGSGEEACAWGASVYTARPFHEHELIHAYFSGLGPAPAILAEGVASGLSCLEFLSTPEAPPDDPSWQAAASHVHVDGTDYGQKRLVRYLIRQHGPEAFTRFYQDSEPTTDPAVFAARFSQFWNQSIDAAWAEATTPGPAPTYLDAPMCPCQSAALPLDGTAVPVAAPYAAFSLPRPFTLAAGSDLAVTLNGLGGTAIRNCWNESYLRTLLRGDVPEVPPATTAFLRSTEGHYYLQALPLGNEAGSISIRPGAWLTETCDAGEAFVVDSTFVGTLEVLAPVASSYLRLSVAGPRTATLEAGDSSLSLCPACDSPAPDCVTAQPLSPVTLGGSYVLELAPGQQAALAFQ
jgi:hypothetical protein